MVQTQKKMENDEMNYFLIFKVRAIFIHINLVFAMTV